jgi:hypothetical protein
MRYSFIFWGNTATLNKVFLFQKRAVRIIMGVGTRYSCRGLCKKLDIVLDPWECIFSLLMFVIKHFDNFLTSTAVHGINMEKTTVTQTPL